MKFQPRNPNRFNEKREVWRSKLDKPIGPGMIITLVPTLLMCVFLVMAAPYLKSITLKFFELDKEHVIVPIELGEEEESLGPPPPPPNPDAAIAEIYQRRFDKEGFDWRARPEIEIPEETRAEIVKEVKPVEVDLLLSPTTPAITVETLEIE